MAKVSGSCHIVQMSNECNGQSVLDVEMIKTENLTAGVCEANASEFEGVNLKIRGSLLLRER